MFLFPFHGGTPTAPHCRPWRPALQKTTPSQRHFVLVVREWFSAEQEVSQCGAVGEVVGQGVR
ncbi:hypothetical protein FACS1894188_12570 [Clostridia bacterium]|nr:hypothetical protein FACS1894188_12570 [Clostridia bacterium]